MPRLTARSVLAALLGLPGAALAADCMANATTTAQMQACAQEQFDTAQAGFAAAYARLTRTLTRAEKQQLNAVQKSFMEYRTRACQFETARLQGGSLRGVAQQQCMARMTEARTAELDRLVDCPEGDTSCRRRLQ